MLKTCTIKQKNTAFVYILSYMCSKMYTSACGYCTVMSLFWKEIYSEKEKNVVLVNYHIGRCFVCYMNKRTVWVNYCSKVTYCSVSSSALRYI